MKTNKHQTLLLVRELETVRAAAISARFGYSAGTARSYLSHLSRQGLIERRMAGYVLTPKGADRATFFELLGCGDPDCPRCDSKGDTITCPTCKRRVPMADARLKPAWDTWFFTRAPGVYCPRCQLQILTEPQARALQIPKVTP